MESYFKEGDKQLISNLSDIVPIDFGADLCRERGWNGSYDWNLGGSDNSCCRGDEGIILNDITEVDYFKVSDELSIKVQNRVKELGDIE